MTGQDRFEKDEEKKSISIDEVGLYKILYINLEEDEKEEKSKVRSVKKDKKEDKAKEILIDIRTLYENIIEDNFYKKASDEKKLKINNWLNELFILIRYLIKFDDYEHEKEYRLLYICDIKKKNKYVKSQICWEGVHVETEKVLFDNEEQKELIFIGPKSNSKVNILKINHYLKCNKLDKCIEIKASDIEFR